MDQRIVDATRFAAETFGIPETELDIGRMVPKRIAAATGLPADDVQELGENALVDVVQQSAQTGDMTSIMLGALLGMLVIGFHIGREQRR